MRPISWIHRDNVFLNNEPRMPIGMGIDALRSRMTGPGGLHNLGNVVALIGGLTVHYMNASDTGALLPKLVEYLFEDFGSASLTLAMIVFLMGGEAYHRAWQSPRGPSGQLIRLGDFLSGLAALIMTFAVARFGNAELAVLAGSLLAFGKLGTAFCAGDTCVGRINVTQVCRRMAIVSRFPSLAALLFTLWNFSMQQSSPSDAATATIMILCYLLWLWGDCLLMASNTRPMEETQRN